MGIENLHFEQASWLLITHSVRTKLQIFSNKDLYEGADLAVHVKCTQLVGSATLLDEIGEVGRCLQ